MTLLRSMKNLYFRGKEPVQPSYRSYGVQEEPCSEFNPRFSIYSASFGCIVRHLLGFLFWQVNTFSDVCDRQTDRHTGLFFLF